LCIHAGWRPSGRKFERFGHAFFADPPANVLRLDAIRIPQHSADYDCAGHAIFLQAYGLALQILRSRYTSVSTNNDCRMPEGSRQKPFEAAVTELLNDNSHMSRSAVVKAFANITSGERISIASSAHSTLTVLLIRGSVRS
jgi:hypothetical protein